MSRPRLFIHVGLQKTGTSYLQSIFRPAADELRAQGLDLVPGSARESFWLMLDVRGRFDPEADPPAAGRSVERLSGQLAASSTPRALFSEESLAPSTDEQIERLLAACESHEVHLVLTVRDLGRQLPSSWQQRLRMGSPETFSDYLDRLERTEGSSRSGVWRQKDFTQVLARWARHVPAERIHVVTVPPGGSPPELLLQRFCQVLEVDPARLDSEQPRVNEALTDVSAELLRRVNSRIDPELRKRQIFGAVGKRYFALSVLGREHGRRILMPAEREEWCRTVSAKYADFLRTCDYDVVGDPEDLMPAASAFASDGVVASETELVDAGVDALATVLTDRMLERRDEVTGSDRPAGRPAGRRPPRPRWRRWVRRIRRSRRGR